jgi:hypothetical protein
MTKDHKQTREIFPAGAEDLFGNLLKEIESDGAHSRKFGPTDAQSLSQELARVIDTKPVKRFAIKALLTWFAVATISAIFSIATFAGGIFVVIKVVQYALGS